MVPKLTQTVTLATFRSENRSVKLQSPERHRTIIDSVHTLENLFVIKEISSTHRANQKKLNAAAVVSCFMNKVVFLHATHTN